MKLIMESWRKKVIEEQSLPDCPSNSMPMFTLLIGMGLWNHLDDEKKAVKIAKAQLDKINADKSSSNLKKVLSMAGIISAGAALVAPPVGATVAAASGGLVLGASTVAATAAFIAEWLEISRDSKVRKGNKAARKILNLFCIDDATLDMLADKYETAYIHDSGVMGVIEDYVEKSLHNHSLQIPDMTKHLIHWVNTKTPYKNSDASELEFKR